MQISNEDNDSVTDIESDSSRVENDASDSDNGTDDGGDFGDDEGGGDAHSGNPGWMDAMDKVIKTGKARRSKKTIVLAKAKKLSSLKKNLVESEETKAEAARNEEARLKRLLIGRSKPNVLDYRKEKVLSKTAVRGLVQLFNAVNKHKKLHGDQSDDIVTSKSKAKREMNKKHFLNLLADGHGVKHRSRPFKEESEIKDEIKEEDSESPYNWKVLQNDFMGQSK